MRHFQILLENEGRYLSLCASDYYKLPSSMQLFDIVYRTPPFSQTKCICKCRLGNFVLGKYTVLFGYMRMLTYDLSHEQEPGCLLLVSCQFWCKFGEIRVTKGILWQSLSVHRGHDKIAVMLRKTVHIYFLECKPFDTWFIYATVGLSMSNDLTPNMRQAFIWINDRFVYQNMHAPLCQNDFVT